MSDYVSAHIRFGIVTQLESKDLYSCDDLVSLGFTKHDFPYDFSITHRDAGEYPFLISIEDYGVNLHPVGVLDFHPEKLIAPSALEIEKFVNFLDSNGIDYEGEPRWLWHILSI